MKVKIKKDACSEQAKKKKKNKQEKETNTIDV